MDGLNACNCTSGTLFGSERAARRVSGRGPGGRKIDEKSTFPKTSQINSKPLLRTFGDCLMPKLGLLANFVFSATSGHSDFGVIWSQNGVFWPRGGGKAFVIFSGEKYHFFRSFRSQLDVTNEPNFRSRRRLEPEIQQNGDPATGRGITTCFIEYLGK